MSDYLKRMKEFTCLVQAFYSCIVFSKAMSLRKCICVSKSTMQWPIADNGVAAELFIDTQIIAYTSSVRDTYVKCA